MTTNTVSRLPEMTDEELYAVDPADLDRGGQNALLRELARRKRDAEMRQGGLRDMTRWKTWGCYVRWGLFVALVAWLAVAGYLAEGG